MYTLEYLRSQAANDVAVEINGKYVTARPAAPFGWWGFTERCKNAWAVFTGRADAFTWPEGQ